MRTVIKLDLFVSIYYKSTFRGAFLLYNTNGHATMDKRPVEPVHKLSTFLPIVADLAYNKNVHPTRTPMTVNLEFTVEEAQAYEDALIRALNNPFIQDDEECAPLESLLGRLGGSIAAQAPESLTY